MPEPVAQYLGQAAPLAGHSVVDWLAVSAATQGAAPLTVVPAGQVADCTESVVAQIPDRTNMGAMPDMENLPADEAHVGRAVGRAHS